MIDTQAKPKPYNRLMGLVAVVVISSSFSTSLLAPDHARNASPQVEAEPQSVNV